VRVRKPIKNHWETVLFRLQKKPFGNGYRKVSKRFLVRVRKPIKNHWETVLFRLKKNHLETVIDRL